MSHCLMMSKTQYGVLKFKMRKGEIFWEYTYKSVLNLKAH